MLETSKAGIIPAIAGINQQDFDEIQLLSGMYPYQKGLQKRIPGKSLQKVYPSPVGSIFVFYNVYGRPYTSIDFGSSISIEPITIPPITLPALPPTGNSWYDDFSGYTPVGLISLLWGAGNWNDTVGVCQTIIDGWFDPFLVYPNVYAGGISKDPSKQPQPLPTPPVDPETTPLPPTDPKFQYPVNPPDLFLNVILAEADNTCQGQGTSPANAIDFINFHDFAGGPVIETKRADSITPGTTVLWRGIKLGRLADVDIGLVVGDCPGPPQPVPVSYFLHGNDGSFGAGT